MVRERFGAYDLQAIKTGDWVTYEFEMSGSKEKYTLSCVGKDDLDIWIEMDSLESAPDGARALCRADLVNRQIGEAWWGLSGEVGRPLKLQDHKRSPAGTKHSNTASVAEEELRIGERAFKCQVITIEGRAEFKGFTTTIHHKYWLAPDLPWPLRSDDLSAALGVSGPIEWSSKPDKLGTVVRHELEISTRDNRLRSTETLSSWGQDAKQTIKTK